MNPKKFSVGIFATEGARDAIALARVAEEAGYDGAWVGDSHMIWNEVYVLLGAIAAQTSRIRIGPGVTHIAAREPSVTASAMATLADLSGGRAVLGIGVGDSGVRNIGREPVSVSALDEAIVTIKALWRGETIDLGGKQARLVNVPSQNIPVYLAVSSSEKTIELASRIGDGVVLAGPPENVPRAVEILRRHEQRAGRKPDEVKVLKWIGCSLSHNSKEAKEAVKPMVARTVMTAFKKAIRNGETLDEEDQKDFLKLRESYDFYQHMGAGHSALVPDRWVTRFALAGDPEEVLNQVQGFQDMVDEIAIVPFGRNRKATIQMFAEHIKPVFQSA